MFFHNHDFHMVHGPCAGSDAADGQQFDEELELELAALVQGEQEGEGPALEQG